MDLFNYYSIIHFAIWFIYGKYFKKNWPLFLFLSLGWEIIELFLPFKFAVEIFENKISDIFINVLGYIIGNLFK